MYIYIHIFLYYIYECVCVPPVFPSQSIALGTDERSLRGANTWWFWCLWGTQRQLAPGIA